MRPRTRPSLVVVSDSEAAVPRRRRLVRLALILLAVAVALFLFSGFVLAPMPNTNQNLSLLDFPVLLASFQCLVGALNALVWIGLRRTNPKWRALQITLLAIASVILTVYLCWPLGWLYDGLFPLSRT